MAYTGKPARFGMVAIDRLQLVPLAWDQIVPVDSRVGGHACMLAARREQVTCVADQRATRDDSGSPPI